MKKLFLKALNRFADFLCDNDEALIYVFLFFLLLGVIQIYCVIKLYNIGE
jgi:hypothetical protein